MRILTCRMLLSYSWMKVYKRTLQIFSLLLKYLHQLVMECKNFSIFKHVRTIKYVNREIYGTPLYIGGGFQEIKK
jgi:hypothetical protein